MAMFDPLDIASDSTLTLDDRPLWLIGLLQSAMWMAWVRTVCGRLKSDIRVDPDFAFYAFPLAPDVLERVDRVESVEDSALTLRVSPGRQVFHATHSDFPPCCRRNDCQRTPAQGADGAHGNHTSGYLLWRNPAHVVCLERRVMTM